MVCWIMQLGSAHVCSRSARETLASYERRYWPSVPPTAKFDSRLYAAKCLATFRTARIPVRFGSCMPATYAAPSVPVSVGSSPYVSCARPQRISRTMLMLGAKKESALLCSRQCFASPSCATARPISRTSGTSQVAAMPIEQGKTVARPVQAMPCAASLKPSAVTWSRSTPCWRSMSKRSSVVIAARRRSRRSTNGRLELYQAHWEGGSTLQGGLDARTAGIRRGRRR